MPRAGIDWDTLRTLEDRIAALLEDTDLTQFRLVIHPDDEAEARKVLRRFKKEVPLYTNGQMTKGSPMLEGVPSPRTTGANDPVDFYEADEAAQKLWQAMRTEARTYPDYKGDRLPKVAWDKLDNIERQVFTNAIRRLMVERVVVLGLRRR